MSDVLSPEQRRKNMRAVKSKNTSIEHLVRTYLHAHGFRFRIHDKKLPGTPDIILKKHNTIIFVHGCYWHRHKNCKYCTMPKKDQSWWMQKFQGTMDRDKKHLIALQQLGWKLIIIWECELKGKKLQETLAKLPGIILSNNNEFY